MSARTMGRRSRVDFASVIEIRDGAAAPGRATAVVTPEGYLDVDAYIARDGLLKYSDGVDSWTEYRPRAELERALASFDGVPITDDHPRTMVSADSWRAVSVGHTLGPPVLEVVDGVAYARQRLRIADAATIAKVRAGKVQVSIGFTTAVVPTVDGYAPDGTRADAVQTDLLGNHDALVDRGRAGPAVRLLMDDVAWYDSQAGIGHAPNEDPHVSQIAKPKTKADEVGQPTEFVTVKAPDGSDCSLPTWAAAIVNQALAAGPAPAAAPGAVPAAAPMAPAPVVPQPDAAVPVAPIGAPPQVAPAAAAPAAAPPKPDDDKDKDMSKDMADLVRKRGRLVRLAAKAGVADDKIDTADDTALAREVIAKRMPYAKAQADKADGAALDALLEVAAALPDVPENPFERGSVRPVTDAATRDENDPEIRFLKTMGG